MKLVKVENNRSAVEAFAFILVVIIVEVKMFTAQNPVQNSELLEPAHGDVHVSPITTAQSKWLTIGYRQLESPQSVPRYREEFDCVCDLVDCIVLSWNEF